MDVKYFAISTGVKSVLLEKLHKAVNLYNSICPYIFMEIVELWKTSN